MAAFGQVNADLVFSSRFQPDLDERRFGIRSDHVDVSHCKFSRAGIPRGVHAECGILREVRTDGEIGGGDSPFQGKTPGEELLAANSGQTPHFDSVAMD